MSFLARNALRGFARAHIAFITKPRSLEPLPRVSSRTTRQLWTPIFARKFASENPTSSSEAPLSAEATTDETVTESPSQPEIEAQESSSAAQAETNAPASGYPNRGLDRGRNAFSNPTPGTTLYAGNLFFEVSEAQLRKEFERIGEVKSVRIVQDHRGLSKGFGYVEFENQADADRAIESLNQQVFEGRRLVVQYHIQKTRAVNNIQPQPPSRTLFIGNLSFEMSDQDLNDLFRDIKNVLDVRVAIDRRSGQPRGFAHADFIDVKSAEQAKDILEGKEIYGRRLRIDFSRGNDQNRAPRAV